MTTRAQKKEATRQKILDVAARRLREEGMRGVAIGPVMAEAGLTHGTFYAHFDSVDALASAAFVHALEENQPNWLRSRDRSWRARLKRLADRYLRPGHRDDRTHGCAIGALASEADIAPASFREVFGECVGDTIDGICEGEPGNGRDADAIALLALCVGGINLSRATSDEKLSRKILSVCRERAVSLASPE